MIFTYSNLCFFLRVRIPEFFFSIFFFFLLSGLFELPSVVTNSGGSRRGSEQIISFLKGY